MIMELNGPKTYILLVSFKSLYIFLIYLEDLKSKFIVAMYHYSSWQFTLLSE